MAEGAGRIEAVLVLLAGGAAGCAMEPADSTGVFAQEIIGGELTESTDYPATGALVRGGYFRCTATLIASDVVVTAGHCLEGDDYGDYGFTLQSDLTERVSNVVPALITHQHPGFRLEGHEYQQIGQRNDVGIVILERPILGVPVERLDSPVQERAAQLGVGTELTLCGYGRDSWSVARSAGMKRDAVISVDFATHWELQSTADGAQPCRGDSGGPVFAEANDGRKLVGLVSRAAGESHQCDSGAIYTRVSPYSRWIWEAARDRDLGCSVGGEGSSRWLWPLLLGCVLASRRRRRAR
jgi:MYXO-CTERM domain-containing protein